jgi:hypothetical protein
MVQLLQNRSQPTTLYKIRAHINIDGNEQADKLAKEGLGLPHENATHPYEHAHTTSYYYQKDEGPVRFLEKQIIKYGRINILENMATQTPNISKWTGNADIDKELSNEFWITPILRTNKIHASSNSARELTWATPEHNFSLAGKDTPPLHVLYATHTNRTHDYTYYSHVDNNIYTHCMLKDTTKQYGK